MAAGANGGEWRASVSAVSKISLAEAMSIGRMDAHGQAGLVRNGEVSAVELVDAAILRIETFDPVINAISHRAFGAARARAAALHGVGSPLAGVPYLLKDSLQYPGMPSHAGSRSRESTPAAWAYPFAVRYDEAGLIPVGMTTMPEFGLLGSTETLRFGPTRNPWALDRSPGGSSGGAAAAVAAGLAALAHASDAAGSIRVPAAACGVIGFKPGRGLNVRARAPHWLDDMLCSDSLIARSVRDVAWAFAAAAPERRAPVAGAPGRRLRIGLMMDGMDGEAPAPAVAKAVEDVARLCEGLGHTVEPAARPAADEAIMDAILGVLWLYLGRDVVDASRARWPGRPLEEMLEPWTIGLAERCGRLGPLDLEAAYAAMARAPAVLSQTFARYDVVLTPAVAEPPVPLGHLAPTRDYDGLMAALRRYMAYTPLQNMAGSPAISLPLSTTAEGLPVGSMFAADRGGEDLLLSLALELEAALPWADRWPAMVAA
jgi:amidase